MKTAIIKISSNQQNQIGKSKINKNVAVILNKQYPTQNYIRIGNRLLGYQTFSFISYEMSDLNYNYLQISMRINIVNRGDSMNSLWMYALSKKEIDFYISYTLCDEEYTVEFSGYIDQISETPNHYSSIDVTVYQFK